MPGSSTASSCTVDPASGSRSTVSSFLRRGARAWRRRAAPSRRRASASARTPGCPCSCLQSETDVILLGGGLAEQPDSERIRVWEMAGAAHADTYTVSAGRHDDGTLSADAHGRAAAPHDEPHDRPDGHARSTPDRSSTTSPRPPWPTWRSGLPAARRPRWHPGSTSTTRGPASDSTSTASRAVAFAPPGWRHRPRSWPVSARAASPSPCSSAAPSLSTRRRCRRSIPSGKDEYLQRFEASLDATIAAGFLLSEDREEILALAAASYPLVVAD